MDECRSYNITQEFISLHEEFIRLSWKAHYHINPEKYLRTSLNFTLFTDISYLICKCTGVIPSAHSLEDGVTAGLEGNVVVRQKFGAGCYPVYHLFGKKVGLDG